MYVVKLMPSWDKFGQVSKEISLECLRLASRFRHAFFGRAKSIL